MSLSKNKLHTLLADVNFTVTPLRKDIIDILSKSSKPLGAYDILKKLRKKRPNAEPPTVYRVLDFLIETKVIHRIETKNTYIFCSHLSHDEPLHQALLLSCKKCQNSYELEDKKIFDAIQQFSKKNRIKIDDTLIEMNGVCRKCFSK